MIIITIMLTIIIVTNKAKFTNCPLEGSGEVSGYENGDNGIPSAGYRFTD